MRVVSIIHTKGGVGKTTTAANMGAFVADAGFRVLLLDLDEQPTLSSYFELAWQAPAGCYELLAFNEHDLSRLISGTSLLNLDIVISNDPMGQLSTLLLHAPDGRFRLRNLLPIFEPHYDLMLIDTQGARSVLLEMALLASDLALSPVTPEILAARELHRGTLQVLEDIAPYSELGMQPPPLHLLINRAHPVSVDARKIQQALRQLFAPGNRAQVLRTVVPAIDAYPSAASHCLPAHRFERTKPYGRVAPAALQTMRELACELFPAWREQFAEVTGGGGFRHAR